MAFQPTEFDEGRRPLPAFLKNTAGYQNYAKIVNDASDETTSDIAGPLREIYGYLHRDKKSLPTIGRLARTYCNGRDNTLKAKRAAVATSRSKKRREGTPQPFFYKEIVAFAAQNSLFKRILYLAVVVAYHDSMFAFVEKRAAAAENSDHWSDEDGERAGMWNDRLQALDEIDYSSAESMLRDFDELTRLDIDDAIEKLVPVIEGCDFVYGLTV